MAWYLIKHSDKSYLFTYFTLTSYIKPFGLSWIRIKFWYCGFVKTFLRTLWITRQHNTQNRRHPCIEWDSNLRFECSGDPKGTRLKPCSHGGRLDVSIYALIIDPWRQPRSINARTKQIISAVTSLNFGYAYIGSRSRLGCLKWSYRRFFSVSPLKCSSNLCHINLIISYFPLGYLISLFLTEFPP
jgi:hypothetical protein